MAPASGRASIMQGMNAYRTLMIIAMMLALMNWRLPLTLRTSSQPVDDAMGGINPPTLLADGTTRWWNGNITNFPSFMLQWPTDRSPPNNCNILNTSIPHSFHITSYPSFSEKEDIFTSYYGDLNASWGPDDATATRGGIRSVESADTNMLIGGDGSTFDQIKTVACTLTEYYHVNDFPHQMEVIYRCWSLWRHFPNAEHVLLIRPKMYFKIVKFSDFSKGMMKVLQESNVSIVAKRTHNFKLGHQFDKPELLIVFARQTWNFKAIRHDDMANLRRSTLTALGLDRYIDQSCGVTNHQMEAGDKGSNRMELPRIVIFNRKKRRELFGAHNISILLQDELNLRYRPPVLFFEAASFEKQVEAFSNIDILLTPHGAQLTSLPFLPRCSSVIEVFPCGYGVVEYFGTLAATSGVNHSYIYLGTDMVAETKRMGSLGTQGVSWNASLCAPAYRMVEAVRMQVEQWNRCCGFQP